MRYSQLLIPTVKEVPADAEIPSHRLMIRAGFIRRVASGTYSYLPLGWRSMRKIMEIVRQEMDAAGAQEVLLPSVQPMELWERTGRDTDYGETMARFTDRHGRLNVLAPTAEEVVTSLAAQEISSYKQLPINLYQISFKFRDEFRPRFGVLRSREFIMKDAYSFNATEESLDQTYRRMYEAYATIFTRCGVAYVVVEAETGEMGGSSSHQFTVPCETGEDVIVHTEDYSYAANLEKAGVDPLPKADPPEPPAAMEEVHTPDIGTIEAVCSFLETEPSEMIKTLIYWTPDEELLARFESASAGVVRNFEGFLAANEAIWSQRGGWSSPEEYADRLLAAIEDGPTAGEKLDALYGALREYYEAATALCKRATVAVVRGDHETNDEKLSGAAEGHIELAPDGVIRAVTGAAVGFAGPMGLAEKVGTILIDHAVAAMPVGVSGANKTDYHVRNVVPGRDFPLEGDNVRIADVRNAVAGDTHGGAPLLFRRGIEVGHLFKLGTKYTEKLACTFLDEKGVDTPCLMGCYGIGINRILASAIEIHCDADGLVLPINIAPFEVEVVPLNNDSAPVIAEAERIHDELSAAGAEVLLDDRDVRPGVKFKDADLIGIPLRVVVGDRGLKEGKVEIKPRTDPKPTLVTTADAVATVLEALERMKQDYLVTSETPPLRGSKGEH